MDLRNARLTALLGCGLSAAALAQTPPDAGRIMQEIRPLEQPPAATIPPIEAPKPKAPAVPAAAGDMRVKVSGFSFSGNFAFTDEQLQAVIAQWSGKSLSFGDLIEAVEAVEAHYKANGYFLAQGNLPPQKIRDGVIEILMSEGLLAEVRLEGESRVNPDILHSHLDRLTRGAPLQLPQLERQILLINELAGLQASLDLQAGEKPGSTDVVLALKPDDVLSGKLELNNHGSPATGEKRLSLTLNGSSPFGIGERINFNAMTSDQGLLDSYNLRGELPVGGDGWKVSATASRAEYSLGDDFKALRASGTADSLRLGLSYPFIRSRATNLKFQIEADQSKLADRFKAAGTRLNKESRGLTATLSWDRNDEFFGGGINKADLAFKTGQLDLGTTAKAGDVLGTDGRFSKANLTLMRNQTLTKDFGLQLQLAHQATGDNLDSSEKLSLGGPTTIAGYANSEGSGDSGSHLKLALRWQALPDLSLTAFTDYARVKLVHDPLPNAGKNHKRLADYGLTTDWQIGKDVAVNFIAAWAGREKPNPTEDDRPRLWLNLGYLW